jgi:hypothetical protein
MMGHLPGTVMREVAELARATHWSYGDVVGASHVERRLWLSAFRSEDEGVPHGREAW